MKGPKEESQNPTLDIIRWMASGNSVHRGHVEAIRKLHIRALAPPQREGSDEATEEPDESFSYSESIMCILPLALQALCNLQTFK